MGIQRMSKGQAKPGDWICPGCLDLQFARNAQCRKCNTPNPNLAPDPVVDEFLLNFGIQDHAAMRFKTLDKNTQEIIMQRGSLEGARDPTAVLMDRMNKASQGKLDLTNNQQPQNGDWYCPGCNDL